MTTTQIHSRTELGCDSRIWVLVLCGIVEKAFVFSVPVSQYYGLFELNLL